MNSISIKKNNSKSKVINKSANDTANVKNRNKSKNKIKAKVKNKPQNISHSSLTRIKDSLLKTLSVEAFKVQEKAYAPYSKFHIGSSLIDSAGNIYTGCNVENSSYGGTICAERTAILKGISEGMKLPIRAICVVSSTDDQWPPCGLCRQVMSEFCDDKTIVYFGNKKGNFKKTTFKKLLPESFSKDFIF